MEGGHVDGEDVSAPVGERRPGGAHQHRRQRRGRRPLCVQRAAGRLKEARVGGAGGEGAEERGANVDGLGGLAADEREKKP